HDLFEAPPSLGGRLATLVGIFAGEPEEVGAARRGGQRRAAHACTRSLADGALALERAREVEVAERPRAGMVAQERVPEPEDLRRPRGAREARDGPSPPCPAHR